MAFVLGIIFGYVLSYLVIIPIIEKYENYKLWRKYEKNKNKN